jgi:hypothetical protein
MQSGSVVEFLKMLLIKYSIKWDGSDERELLGRLRIN